MQLPQDLRYTSSHEWVRDNGDGTFTVGITDHAQDQLGSVVFAEVQAVGKTVKAGNPAGVVESVKAVSDIYCPLDAEVLAANPDLDATPELINEDPYGKGWLFTIRPADASAVSGLLDAAGYQASVG